MKLLYEKIPHKFIAIGLRIILRRKDKDAHYRKTPNGYMVYLND